MPTIFILQGSIHAYAISFVNAALLNEPINVLLEVILPIARLAIFKVTALSKLSGGRRRLSGSPERNCN